MADRLNHLLERIDLANSEDPTLELADGVAQPAALLYGRRMSEWLGRLRAEAPEPLHIAARAQHIERWKIPRATYPADRLGYLQWRKALARFHAERTALLMREAGYDEATIARTQFLLEKKQVKSDPDTATLEDTACLVFLQHYLEEFATKTEHAKMIAILQKTWGKMSAAGHEAASSIALTPAMRTLLSEALTAKDSDGG